MRKRRCFQELTRNLQYEGFTVKPETDDGLLPVELDGQRLCLVLDTGALRHWMEDVDGDARYKALHRATDIVKATAEYMGQVEAAPQLTVGSLAGDYRLLAEFNGVVLVGHPTQYGVQFVTWERAREDTGLNDGNYYGPCLGVGSYAAAKRGCAVRPGLVARNALFALERLAEVYRSIHETLESAYPMTDKRRKCLESAAGQIERYVPDLDARVRLSN